MCCSKVIIWRIIAITTMLISCILIALAIAGMLTYQCTFNPDLSTFQFDNLYLLYTVYFFNNKCIDNSSNYQEQMPDPSDRTWGWAITYLVLSTLWFFSSLLLFNATNYWKSTASLFLTYPWLFLTFIILCTDVAASVMYALDFQSVETLDKLYNFLGLDAIPESREFAYLNQVREVDNFIYIPLSSIIMVAVFSKVIIGWIFVFISFVTIFLLLIKVGKNDESLILETRAPVDYYYNSAMTNQAYEMTEVQHPDSLQYLQRNGHLSFVDIPLDDHHPPQLIPRPSLHTTNRDEQIQYNRPMDLSQINAEYFADDWDEGYRNSTSPQSPRSILKNQQNNRFSNDLHNQKPWTYLSSSQPESLESENRHQMPPTTQTYYY